MFPSGVYANENIDTDGDGIPDVLDACVNELETYNDYLDADGCPDIPDESTTPVYADSDGDGYPDTIDACPNLTESWNKFQDDDGCPDVLPSDDNEINFENDIDILNFIDLDNDGVVDAIDACPNLQEDYESGVDGCPSNFVPWYDEDYDGIEDHIDQCPNLKENYNKFQDDDGCPDILSIAVEQEVSLIQMEMVL